MTSNQTPLPPNTLILPVSLAVADQLTAHPREAERIVRRSCHFLSPGDHLTIRSVRPLRDATSILRVIEITFDALTAQGRHVYCSPIDWTSSTPTVEVHYSDAHITRIGSSIHETAGGQTPHESGRDGVPV